MTTTGERVRRIHLARDAVISALVSIEQHQHADAMILSAIAMLHLSHAADEADVQRVMRVVENPYGR